MRFLLAGDSTVAACPPQEHPMSGWGAALERRLRPEDVVVNFAKGGATTQSFIAEGLWGALLAQARPGDVAVIQSGNNDQRQPDCSPRRAAIVTGSSASSASCASVR